MQKTLFLSLVSFGFFLLNGYTQSGTFDSNFDADGLVLFEVDPGVNICSDVVVAPDGKIIMAGYTGSSSDPKFAVARLNPDGSPDNTFSIDGKTTTNIFDRSEGNAVALQSDGKILVAGSANMNFDNLDWFAVARYNTDGTLDNTFGANGIATTYFGESNDVAYAMVIQPDGKIVVGGSSYDVLTGLNFAIARFDTDGSLDNTFSFDGKITTDFNTGFDAIYSLTLQPDGKILAAGYADITVSFAKFGLARYNSDGTLDNTFGSGGKVAVGESNFNFIAREVMLMPDGKILLIGRSDNAFSGDYITIARLNSDGSLDITFSDDGIISHNPAVIDEYPFAGALQADGKILVAGSSAYYSGKAFVARFNADGNLDNSFGNNGVLAAPSGYDGEFLSLAIQPDLKIIAAGTNDGNEFLAARIMSGLNLGILDFASNTETLLYPNPVQESAVFEFEIPSGQTLTASIYDAQGRLVQSVFGKKFFDSGKHQISINVGQLSAGQYMLILDNGSGRTALHFLK